jgi:hypothetical protein
MNDEDLRDLFAGLAMQGYLSTEYFRGASHKFVAEESYRIADAMLDAKYADEEPEPEMGITAIKRKRKTTKEE